MAPVLVERPATSVLGWEWCPPPGPKPSPRRELEPQPPPPSPSLPAPITTGKDRRKSAHVFLGLGGIMALLVIGSVASLIFAVPAIAYGLYLLSTVEAVEERSRAYERDAASRRDQLRLFREEH